MRQRPEKKEYSFEVVETAENLYVYKNKTYEEISKILDIPVVTLQRWGADEKPDKGGKGGYEWRKKKLEYIKQRVGTRKELYLIKDHLIKEAKENTDPLAVYKLATLQRTIDAEEKGDIDESMQKIDRPQIFLDFLKDLVSYLKEHDAEALVALEKNFDPFIGFAKSKYANP